MSALLGACSPAPTPSPGPTTRPSFAAGIDWATAEVRQPSGLVEEASGRPSFCSPCHSAVQTSLGAVAGAPGRLLAVGWYTPFRAAAWASTDGRSWAEVDLRAPDGGLLDAVAATGSGWLAGGTDGVSPAVWQSDGGHWLMRPLPVPDSAREGSRSPGSVTSVLATGGVWLAAGQVGAANDPSPAIWRSTDRQTWQLASLEPSSAAGGRSGGGAVAALAAGDGGTLVAVGQATPSPEGGSAAAWISNDGGATWLAGHGADLSAGTMAGVAAANGRGFVAVGAGRTDEGSAPVWRSDDGRTWVLDPGEATRSNDDRRIRMTALASNAGRLVAGGWKSDAGNGSAMLWRSDDGATWKAATTSPSFSGGGVAGLAALGNGWVAVGSTGWPDDRIATVWLSPPP